MPVADRAKLRAAADIESILWATHSSAPWSDDDASRIFWNVLLSSREAAAYTVLSRRLDRRALTYLSAYCVFMR